MPEKAPSHITFDELTRRLSDAFIANGASPENAQLIARNCAACERDGSTSHGVFRIPGYLGSLRTGWLDGAAVPTVKTVSPSYLRVDAANGFAQVALDAARPHIERAVAETSVALVAIRDAHHFSSLWPDVEPFARQGLVALTMVTGGDSIVVPPGATERIFGTNPVAFATPRAGAEPLVWDFATSTMSHGDVTIARNEGRTLPIGRGVGIGGRDTGDPAEILDHGGLLPVGGHKGALIMLMVEALASGLTGAPFSTEADLGKPTGAETSRIGQVLIVLDPERDNPGSYASRVGAFVEMLREAGMSRIPAEERAARRAAAERDGIPVTTIMREVLADLLESSSSR